MHAHMGRVPNTSPMNDLWSDIRFLSGAPPIQVVVLGALVVPPRLLSSEDARGSCPSCNCTPSAKMEWEEGRIVGRIGLTKSVVRRDRGELCRLSPGDLIPVTRA